MSEKLHKVLARAGLGSRRQIERWIEQGRITVDGQVARIGMRVPATARVKVNGKPVRVTPSSATPRVLVYHKPEGQICTRADPRDRPSVFDGLPPLPGGRWISVGRLDINTSGLLLFTNDGELAHRLMHPRHGMRREYLVRVIGYLRDEDRQRLLDGIDLDGRLARFAAVEEVRAPGGVNRWYRVALFEGRHREVRRLCEAVGATVNRLKRVRFGPVRLPADLTSGAWRELTGPGLRRLLKTVDLQSSSTAVEQTRVPTLGRRHKRH